MNRPTDQNPTYGKAVVAPKPATNNAPAGDVSDAESVKTAPKPASMPSPAKDSVTTPMRAKGDGDSQEKQS